MNGTSRINSGKIKDTSSTSIANSINCSSSNILHYYITYITIIEMLK